MVPRGGHRLNEPVVGEVGGRGGGGPDPLHPETPPFSKRVPKPWEKERPRGPRDAADTSRLV